VTRRNRISYPRKNHQLQRKFNLKEITNLKHSTKLNIAFFAKFVNNVFKARNGGGREHQNDIAHYS